MLHQSKLLSVIERILFQTFDFICHIGKLNQSNWKA